MLPANEVLPLKITKKWSRLTSAGEQSALKFLLSLATNSSGKKEDHQLKLKTLLLKISMSNSLFSKK
jgi:hypothetical protein